MSGIKRIMLILSLLAVICRGGYALWQIAGQYAEEAQVKQSLDAYRRSADAPGALVDAPGALADAPGAIRDTARALADASRILPNAGARPSDRRSGALFAEGLFTYEQLPEDPAISPAKAANPLILKLQEEINRDIAGWLTVPGTQIDYPFVWSGDHEAYLRQDVYGNRAEAGTLFMDYRCPQDLSAFNTIIYGHHMKNGSMFGGLKRFGDEAFFHANPDGEIMTGSGTYALEIFAYMVVRADDAVIYHTSPEKDMYYAYIKENARQYREPDRGRSVVTLSTCAYEFPDARIVLLANLSTTSKLELGDELLQHIGLPAHLF